MGGFWRERCPICRKQEIMPHVYEIKSPVGLVSQSILDRYNAGEAIGITVKCMDGQFEVSEWCLHHSDILLRLLEARDNFQGKKNKIFDLKQFRQCSIKKVYDSLHGISRDYVELAEIVEIMAYCLIDGKVEQKSVFETRLYNDLLEQLKNDKDI